MKPKELCIDLESRNKNSMSKVLFNYLNRDCVIAYNKNKTSVVFLIKTKKTYMGFYYITRELEYYMFNKNTLKKIDLQLAVNLIKNEGVILDNENFSRVKKKIILNNLK